MTTFSYWVRLFYLSLAIAGYVYAPVLSGMPTPEYKASIFNQHIRQGEKFEGAGDLPNAIEAYKAAIGVATAASFRKKDAKEIGRQLSQDVVLLEARLSNTQAPQQQILPQTER